MQAEKLVIEADDVCQGLVQLIAQHKITNLVMGAAADKKFSKYTNYIYVNYGIIKTEKNKLLFRFLLSSTGTFYNSKLI